VALELIVETLNIGGGEVKKLIKERMVLRGLIKDARIEEELEPSSLLPVLRWATLSLCLFFGLGFVSCPATETFSEVTLTSELSAIPKSAPLQPTLQLSSLLTE
jgi:hypothetical protein